MIALALYATCRIFNEFLFVVTIPMIPNFHARKRWGHCCRLRSIFFYNTLHWKSEEHFRQVGILKRLSKHFFPTFDSTDVTTDTSQIDLKASEQVLTPFDEKPQTKEKGERTFKKFNFSCKKIKALGDDTAQWQRLHFISRRSGFISDCWKNKPKNLYRRTFGSKIVPSQHFQKK